MMEDLPKLDPAKTALVVIDLQKGVTGRELAPHSAAAVVENASKLARAFREAGAFVVLVNVSFKDGKDALAVSCDQPMQRSGRPPPDWADLVPELEAHESDLRITKRQWGAFHGTELDLQLRRRGISAIVLCGISTNIGVETTAREAYQLGYDQVFALDGMSAMSLAEHESSVKFIFPRIGKVRSTESILRALR